MTAAEARSAPTLCRICGHFTHIPLRDRMRVL
jgi:hypothetical protein